MKIDFISLEQELINVLGLDGGEVTAEKFHSFLYRYFQPEVSESITKNILKDLSFFIEHDPASNEYTEFQVLSVRRGMAAIATHRIFQALLELDPNHLYEIELIAKHVQKDTNVEIHPLAKIASPFAMDHGHSTVIGATSQIEPRVFMYHSVTLGASNLAAKSGRRHPKVGQNVFFGNGSQVLGPSIIGEYTYLAAGVIVRDSLINPHVHISMRVRVAGVVIPSYTKVLGEHPEDRSRYWVQAENDDEPKWVSFQKFISDSIA
ncbi:MAG: hypothetical protein AAGA18_01330 [Verrucomicrobiota bacterium]